LGGVAGFINAVQPGGANPGGNDPQAFLTVLFFDERFNFIPAADGGVAQQQVLATVGSNGSSLTLANIKAPKNGYAYVYLSNQSNNDVYFDNFQVGITQGNIAEENHYYAYGLKIATLSSKKLGDNYEGSLKNNYLYQGAFSELDDDIGWNDFYLRNYDPQIGRWVQQDPYQEFATPYTYVGNDPINFTDPSGGSILYCPGTSALAIFFDKAFQALIKAGPITAKISIGLTIGKTAAFITKMAERASMINGQLATMMAGSIGNGSSPSQQDGEGNDPLERIRMLVGIAMGEGGMGYNYGTNAMIQIAYVYIHREARNESWNASTVWQERDKNTSSGINYRAVMQLLGSPTYALDKTAQKALKTFSKEQISLVKELYQELQCYESGNSKEYIPAAKYEGINGQFYDGDLNGFHSSTEDGKAVWNKVRWYIRGVLTGLIPNNNTVFILPDTKHKPGRKGTTFLVDWDAINKWVRTQGSWINDKNNQAPIYDPETNKFQF
jgi:RHS repeat-associated protein